MNVRQPLKIATTVGLDSVDRNLAKVQAFANTLRSYLKLVADLVAAGEARRVGRVNDINVGPIRFDGQKVEATVAGTTGKYTVRITVAPKRGHHCICPDWERNGKTTGPCKHVLALGLAWKNEMLLPTVDYMDDNLTDILERSF